jgi:hypothetical protein
MLQRRKTTAESGNACTNDCDTPPGGRYWLSGSRDEAPATPSKNRTTKRDLLDSNSRSRSRSKLRSIRSPPLAKQSSIPKRFLHHFQSRKRLAVWAVLILLASILALLLSAWRWWYGELRAASSLVYYASRQEQHDRRLRFPGVEDRVKLYMSNWYVPPCQTHNKAATIPYAMVVAASEADLIAPMLEAKNKGQQQQQQQQQRETTTTTSTTSTKIQQLVLEELPGLHPTRGGIYIVQDDVQMAQLLYMTPEKMIQCANTTNNEYCPDMVDTLLPALQRSIEQQLYSHHNDGSDSSTTAVAVPIMTQMGDSGVVRAYNGRTNKWDAFPSIPIIMKYRFAFEDPDALAAMTASDCYNDDDNNNNNNNHRPIYSTYDKVYAAKYSDYYQPIVWKVTSSRHFGMISKIPALDIPYPAKKDMAVFRGALTGVHRDGYTVRMKDTISDHDKCLLIHRCRLVYKTAGSSLVDAKLVTAKINEGVEEEIPNMIGKVEVYGSKYTYDMMLQYKAIVMLEGNDISSGLKWALYSNSVVMTQPPTKTSWAMEELLEAWVHYVPLNDDLSDVEEKMQWIVQNPGPAEQIAYRGSLWIRDLLLHPDAQQDDERIYDEIIRRYRDHFFYQPSLVDHLGQQQQGQQQQGHQQQQQQQHQQKQKKKLKQKQKKKQQ